MALNSAQEKIPFYFLSHNATEIRLSRLLDTFRDTIRKKEKKKSLNQKKMERRRKKERNKERDDCERTYEDRKKIRAVKGMRKYKIY